MKTLFHWHWWHSWTKWERVGLPLYVSYPWTREGYHNRIEHVQRRYCIVCNKYQEERF